MEASWQELEGEEVPWRHPTSDDDPIGSSSESEDEDMSNPKVRFLRLYRIHFINTNIKIH